MYRKEIDGLRTLAVLSVIAFHFGGVISGGFVGVDIFFVISGFLITSILLRDLEAGKFSFATFYKRRIKRILPALYTVISVAFILSYFIMPPFELDNMAKSALFSILNSSNLYFWKTADYFDVSVDYKPFLHTWSLSVEEQFYIFFPFILWLIFKYKSSSLKIILPLLVIISFILSVYIQNDMQSANFYLLPTRAWELGAGSMLAYFLTKPIQNVGLRSGISWLGMALMLVPIFTYEETIIFPGMTALPVVLGTVCFIASGFKYSEDKTLFWHKIFENSLIVWIGKISYSLYLWHWMIYVFCLLYMGKTPESYLTMLILTFILSVLSYYLVENPLRHIKSERSEKLLLWGILAWSIILGLFSYAMFSTKGFYNRFDSKVQGAYEGQFNYDKDMSGCAESAGIVGNLKHCVKGAENKTPEILMWGDSHGRALLAGLRQEAEKADQSILVRNVGGCVPSTGEVYINRALCHNYNVEMMKLVKERAFKKVILAGRWSLHYDGEEFHRKIKFFQVGKGQIQDSHITEAFTKDFTNMVKEIRKTGAEVYIIDSVPGYPVHVPELLLRPSLPDAGRTKELTDQVTTQDIYFKQSNGFRQFVEGLHQEDNKVHILYPYKKLCNQEGNCLLADKNGRSYYRDTNHLSEYGSLFIAPLWKEIFNN